ncbi:site-specific integrase [Burkholderia pseudomallei]|uniref:site-specific integrase n=1 Tax=Burkholderia pseudomallei TaxID=28450 RepID=UPI003D647479
MRNKSSFPEPSHALSLPAIATTRNGVSFDPTAERWAYRDGSVSMSMDFSAVKGAAPDLIVGMKLTLLWYAENMSPNHTQNGFTRIKHFLERQGTSDGVISEITSVELMNYRSQLGARTKWYLGTLAGFLKKWHELGIPGVTKDAVAFLSEIRLPGNEKGAAVRTWDPKKGPFTNIEREAIQTALNAAYADGKVSTGDYLLAWLFMLLGPRPAQYSYLKVCDVKTEARKDGSTTYILSVPRAKQRGEPPRSSFKERALIPQIGTILMAYAASLAARFAGDLEDPTQAPLFPEIAGRAEHPDGLSYHRTAGGLGKRAKAIFESLQVVSERTGRPMDMPALRFRRTIGTQAAAEGHGELIIAELLDHSDTQNVDVYVEASPEFIERIDRTLAMRLAPLAQAFAGALVDGETDAVSDPSKRIVAPQYSQNFEPVGKCGQHGFCGFAAPVACYTCANFQAWLDGPHEDILNSLLADRERLLQTTDSRIASVNDRTILAVAQVVKMCQEAQAAGGTNG